MTISPWYQRTLAQHLGPVPDQAIEHRSSGHPAVITGAQLSAIAAKPSTGTAAQTSNPHSRPGAHRLPAGSFFGGFRTPALGSAARVNDPPASETLHDRRPPNRFRTALNSQPDFLGTWRDALPLNACSQFSTPHGEVSNAPLICSGVGGGEWYRESPLTTSSFATTIMPQPTEITQFISVSL